MRSDPASVASIERQFSLKNTMGYGINAFLDFESPVDLLPHLIIGTEGTLAFVAEATFRTVPVSRSCRTALAVFPSLDDGDARAARAGRVAEPPRSSSWTPRPCASGSVSPAARRRSSGSRRATDAALLVEYRSEDAVELEDSRHGSAVCS